MYESVQSNSGMMSLPMLAILILSAILFVAWLCSCFYVVKPRAGRLVQLFGGRVVNAKVTTGIGFKAPFPIHTVTENISLAEFFVSEIMTSIRTSDNSVVGMKLTAFLARNPDDFENSVFAMLDSTSQIKSIISEATKEIVPELTLDDLFKDRSRVQDHVLNALKTYFSEYGFIFKKVVVDDPELDEATRDSMNAVKRADLDLSAAKKNRDAIKEREVGAAEAAAESLLKRSQASIEVRKNNGKSLADTIKAFQEEAPGVPVSYLMDVLQGIDERDAIVSASGKEGNVVVVSTGKRNDSTDDSLAEVTALIKSLSGKSSKDGEKAESSN